MTCCDTEFPPSSWDRKLPTVTRNFFLWQEISSYDKKFLPVTRNFFLWQDISSCDKKFLPVTRNFFLWQEISSYYKKSSCGKKVLPMKQENIFGLQKSIGLTGTFCFILHEIPSCQICDKYAWISANISCEPEDFVGTWLPGSPGISHPGGGGTKLKVHDVNLCCLFQLNLFTAKAWWGPQVGRNCCQESSLWQFNKSWILTYSVSAWNWRLMTNWSWKHWDMWGTFWG